MLSRITKEEVVNFQQEWGQNVVEIGQLFLSGKSFKEFTYSFVERFYAYDEGSVLFKPTRAAHKQFRTTFKGAISYFISGDEDFPEDTGFALQPWVKVRFENLGFILESTYAISMGNYFFTDRNDKVKKVEYTIGYIRTKNGKLKINLHHSSMPFRALPHQ